MTIKVFKIQKLSLRTLKNLRSHYLLDQGSGTTSAYIINDSKRLPKYLCTFITKCHILKPILTGSPWRLLVTRLHYIETRQLIIFTASEPIFTMLVHTLTHSIPSFNKIRKDFNCQGHCDKVKDQIKVTPWCCTPTPTTNAPTKYQHPTRYSFSRENIM